MFCPKCGNQLADNSVVCPICGEQFSTGIVKNKNRAIGIAAVVIAVVLLFVGVTSVFGGRSREDVVDVLFDSMLLNADAKAFIELFPEELVNAELKENDMTRKEAINELQDELEDVAYYIGYYIDDYTFTYEIVDTYDMDKETVKDLSDDCKEEWGFKVSDAKIVTVEFTVEATVLGSTEKESYDMDITMIKTGRSWYLWVVDGDSFDDLI